MVGLSNAHTSVLGWPTDIPDDATLGPFELEYVDVNHFIAAFCALFKRYSVVEG